MRKLLISLLFSACITANAQTDSSAIEFLVPPDSTGIGAPDGNPVNKEIGPGGGKITSEDGRIELIFPAGALTAPTSITIQPTINHAPNGSGRSYWFQPSGIQFKKPVQIIFHYSDEEAEDCPPELMSWATQNESGKWTFIEYEEMDSVSKTLKGWIQHFSGGSNVYKLKLVPEKTQLCVGEKTKIRIWRVYPPSEGAFIEMQHTSGLNSPAVWFVNKIESGNGSVGYVVPIQSKDKVNKQSIHSTEYLAPDFLVKKNPVTVSVDLYVYSGKGKVYNKARTLSCKINIYDVYEVSVSVMTDLFNNVEFTDSSTLYVWVYPGKLVVDNVKNYPPYISKQVKQKCSLVLYTQGFNGFVHLIKERVRISDVSADQPPKVKLDFLHDVETAFFQFHWVCPNIAMIPPETLYNTPIAPEVNFIANGESQVITTKMGSSYYGTVRVKPYRK